MSGDNENQYHPKFWAMRWADEKTQGVFMHCQTCNEEFKPGRKNQKFCHHDCRALWYSRNENKKSQPSIIRLTKMIEEKNKAKLTALKELNYICPGCGVDFKGIHDKALTMIFEICHYHAVKCPKRIKDASFFVACRLCNGRQAGKCGSWGQIGILKELCPSGRTLPKSVSLK